MSNSSFNSLVENIEKYQEDYYSQNKKNLLFKNSQKLELSKKVCSQYDIGILMEKTIYSSNASNQIFLDYHVFKLYANPENFELIKNYAVNVFTNIRDIYSNIEIHVDLRGFTISAAERYRKFIELICSDCLNQNNDFITQIYIYNPPSVIQHFFNLFGSLFTQSLCDKITVFSTKK
jgi:hypothetical protein